MKKYNKINVKIKLILVLVMLFTSSKMWAQEEPNGEVLGIEKLSATEGFQNFDTLKFSMAKYFILGGPETYTSKMFPHFSSAFLNHVHVNYGVKKMMVNMGYSEAYLLNKIAQNDDSVFLNRVKFYFPDANDLLYSTRFLKSINDHSNDGKIEIQGYSLPKNLYASVELLYQLTKSKELPDQLRIPVESVQALAKYNWLKLSQNNSSYDRENSSYSTNSENLDNYESRNTTVMYFLNSFDSLKSTYKEWLGADFGLVENIVNEIKGYKYFKETDRTPFLTIEEQERKFNQIKSIIEQYPEDKFVILMDRCNAAYESLEGLCDFSRTGTLAAQLIDRMKIVATKVVNIGTYSKYNSNAYSYTGSSSYKTKSKMEEKYDNELDEIEIKYENGVYLFDTKDNGMPLISTAFNYVVMSYDFEPDYIDTYSYAVAVDTSYYDNYNNYKYKEVYNNVGFYYQTINRFPNLKNFNNSLKSIGYQIPDNMFVTAGAAYVLNSEKVKLMIDYTTTGGLLNKKTELKLYDTATFSSHWSSWSVNEAVGGNVINHKNLILTVGGQLGYYSNRIRQYPINTGTTFFPNDYKQPTTYRNNAILFGPFSSLHINFAKIFSVGVTGGYQLDASRKGWLLNGKYTGDRAQLSYNMLWYSTQFGIVIPFVN